MRRRVKKEEVKADTWVKPDGLDECLRCWKEWMAGDPDRDLGAKTLRGLMGNSDGYGGDPEEQQQASDARIAAATDAMIDSLKRIHIWAIYESLSVGTVWRFPNADLVQVYVEARTALEDKLRKNVCTGVLF
jgi:hypothetical protein